MEKTPLESWIYSKITGLKADSGQLTRTMIEKYQLQKLQETLDLARANSLFYRHRFAEVKRKISSFEEFAELPFTTAEDIRENPLHLLCVSQSEINRVVTLNSSGTTGIPKRIYFTEADQELTLDFFHRGMATLVKPGDRVLILLPGELPGSVGDLLYNGLRRLGAVGIHHGPVHNVRDTIEIMCREKVDALVGIPNQVLALARYRDKANQSLGIKLKSVLLSTDYVPAAIVRELQKEWHCKVFNHYGMTEMGLGGGVECQALAGYHLREADLYFEIINPATGVPVTEGESGEIVFTTLTRRGMPLIRYRTGDISRFIPEPCPCGTVLKRMDLVKKRAQGEIKLGSGIITMADFDESLFPLPGLLDFRVAIEAKPDRELLRLELKLSKQAGEKYKEQALMALQQIPAIKEVLEKGNLEIDTIIVGAEGFTNRGTSKRTIQDMRNEIR